MKKLFLLFIIPLSFFGQAESDPCVTLKNINKVIQENHYRPKALNDSLSNFVFTTFIETIDPNNKLFLKNEITNLSAYKYKVDDFINSENCSFLEDIYSVFLAAIERKKQIYIEFETELTHFEYPEPIYFSAETYEYVNDLKALKRVTKQNIIFEILQEVAETSKNKDSLVSNFDKIAQNKKAKILESNNCKLKVLQLSKKDFYNVFYNIFCSYFDPHTNFLSSEDKSSFLTQISSDNLTFGLNLLLNEKEELIVDSIIPGSEAYLNSKIENSDQIIKIKTSQDELEISCMESEKIEAVFYSSDILKATITFRKKNGEIYTAELEKKEAKNYDVSINSFVLKKGDLKVGYVKIPSFYGEIEEGLSTVSSDLAKEILKLKKDNISGLIIDVQNNGGGSMQEASKLTGMLINKGPIGILNYRNNITETIRDPNIGAFYSGPLVVLVNGYSASASEFFANAIQDYNRGIIVGTKTRGKASMQIIAPISETNENEFIKITIEEFYRITGKSNQYIGITPDVELPELFDNQIERERDAPNALPNQEVNVKMRYDLVLNPKKEDAIFKSKQRILESEYANNINKLNIKIDTLFNNDYNPIDLNFSAVFDEMQKSNLFWEDINSNANFTYPIEVIQNSEEIEYQKFDNFAKSHTAEKIKEIKKNLHIFESINIIEDLTKN